MRDADSRLPTGAREDTESAVFGPYSAAFTVLAALGFTRFSEDSAEYRFPPRCWRIPHVGRALDRDLFGTMDFDERKATVGVGERRERRLVFTM